MRLIAGKWKSRELLTPKGLSTRPSASRLRETLFNLLRNHVEGATCLDLFAGSGALGFEALSRGATSVTFIETSRAALDALKKNSHNLGAETLCHIIPGDVFHWLTKLEKQGAHFDLILADPPYGTFLPSLHETYSQKLLELCDDTSLINPQGFLIIEEAKEFPLDMSQLHTIKQVDLRSFGRTQLYLFERSAI